MSPESAVGKSQQYAMLPSQELWIGSCVNEVARVVATLTAIRAKIVVG